MAQVYYTIVQSHFIGCESTVLLAMYSASQVYNHTSVRRDVTKPSILLHTFCHILLGIYNEYEFHTNVSHGYHLTLYRQNSNCTCNYIVLK